MPLLAPVTSAVLDGASSMSADRSTISAKGGSPSGTKSEESSYGCTDAFALPHPLARWGGIRGRALCRVGKLAKLHRGARFGAQGQGARGSRQVPHRHRSE